jgi:hypothetical protein
MTIVPFDVAIVARYRFAESMTIGGSALNFWRFGLEPSTAGTSDMGLLSSHRRSSVWRRSVTGRIDRSGQLW